MEKEKKTKTYIFEIAYIVEGTIVKDHIKATSISGYDEHAVRAWIGTKEVAGFKNWIYFKVIRDYKEDLT